VKHGQEGKVYAGTLEDSVWVGISDRGPGIDALILPQATLQRGFSTKPSLGLGYSIMLDIADRVLLNTGPGGTTVILIKKTSEPETTFSLDNIPDTWEGIPS
jgi:anti-sigma regulatory factor (Ser/Thr protein kinase)